MDTNQNRKGSTERIVSVRVAASTSNLGPGFDLLGLALSLFLDVETRVGGDAHELVELEGTAASWPRGADNLILRAFDAYVAARGAAPIALSLRARSEIPIERGLGSSGAAIAAGLLLARAWTDGDDSSLSSLLSTASELDGHPDNTTASLCGGCTLALPHARGLRVVRQPLHASLGFAVAWPASTVPTAAARRALPSDVPFADAVENPRRLAALLEGLRTGDPELLALGEEDRLHVKHRLPLIPGAEQALRAAHDAGAWLATISGSGSALVALGAEGRMENIASAMAKAFRAAGSVADARVLRPALDPPDVVVETHP